MIHRREPDRPPVAEAARELTKAEYLDKRTRGLRSTYANEPETLRQLRDRIELTERSVRVRHFGCAVDGTIASVCDLYTDDKTAQIEYVDTLEAYRGRGLARAMLSLASDTARREDLDFIFLFAEGDDWPKELYRKLGFDDLQTFYELHQEAEANPDQLPMNM